MAGLRERLASTASQDWASTVFDHLRLMRPASHARTALAARAVRAIGRGQVVIGELARELAIGERQLERVMARDVGLTPTEVVRIARVQSALRRVRQDPGRALGHIALESGFYDQPHFTREFRRLVGCSPSHFQADELSLTHHFVSNDVGPLQVTREHSERTGVPGARLRNQPEPTSDAFVAPRSIGTVSRKGYP